MSAIEERDMRSGKRFLVRFRDGGAPRSRTFTTRDQAERWQAILDNAGPKVAIQVFNDATSALAVQENLTVASWVDQHISGLTGITEGTRSDYRSYLKRDMTNGIGQLPLPALNRQAVSAWINGLSARKLSGKSIRNRHALLSAAASAAVEAGHLSSNPCRGMRLPDTSHLRKTMVVLSNEEQTRLLTEAPRHWRPLIFTMLRTGMRWGEATALMVGDVRHAPDLRQSVHVRQAWKHTDSKVMELGPPKSRKGTRTIPIDAETAAVLAPLCNERTHDSLVFTAPRGGPARQATFHEDIWGPALTRAGFSPRPRIHDLRHTYASAMLAAGVPLHYLQTYLGHESIKTTSDTYGHLLADAHEAAVAALGRAFAPSASLAAPGAPQADSAALPSAGPTAVPALSSAC